MVMSAAQQVGDGYASIALVDLSYLFKKNWHGTPRDAAPGAAAQLTLDQLAGIRERAEHVIVCLDAPPYRRKEIDPEYKAQRERPADEELSQKRWLIERIEKDGYRIARSKGYEADDVIATLAKVYWWCPDVRIIGADKDCAQCVTESVRMFVPGVGERPAEVRGPAEIKTKYGVEPKDMGLWLALVGDSSDNIRGVPGIGPKKAAQLINDCQSLTGIAEALAVGNEDGAKPSAMWKALADHWDQLVAATKLTALDTAVPIDANELLTKREPVRLVEDEDMHEEELPGVTEAEFDPISRAPEGYQAPQATAQAPVSAPSAQQQTQTARPAAAVRKSEPPPKPAAQQGAAIVRSSSVTEDLQPLDIDAAYRLAKAFTNGRLYGKFQSPEAIFTIIVKARELGLKVTTALDGFHIIEGKPSASADMIRSLAERHPDCEYFRLVESTAESATWETKHRRHPEATRYTYTIAEARQAGLSGGNWAKRPRDMVTKTAASKLARIVYPGAVMGLYCPEEMDQ
jgi:5'-3' exonuclease